MAPLEYAKLLLRKASQDEFVLAKLLQEPATPDEIIGFHGQQAVEKMLKAVLAAGRIPYRRTHDLVELIDLLRDAGLPFPEELDEVRRLTPFAVEFRYDDLPEETGEKPLDRAWIATAVGSVREWAEGIIRQRTS